MVARLDPGRDASEQDNVNRSGSTGVTNSINLFAVPCLSDASACMSGMTKEHSKWEVNAGCNKFLLMSSTFLMPGFAGFGFAIYK